MQGELVMPNTDWKPGHYETDNDEFLDLISECWVEMFNERLSEVGIKAKAAYTVHWSPKEYNFGGDQADFILTIAKAEVKRLSALCLADGRFKQHLIDHYSSRDGFWSFRTNSVETFTENAEGAHGEKEYEQAVWQAVNFIMFPDKGASEAWNERFTENVYELDFSGTLRFVEDNEEA
jgi:hypothetical protein